MQIRPDRGAPPHATEHGAGVPAADSHAPARVPASTYRVQVSPGFDVDAAAGVVGYLADLGVACLHISPLLQSAPGSAHGHDVLDHSRVREEIGGERARRRLVRVLRAAGLSLLADIVPDHTGVRVPKANLPWWDVLKHGPASTYAGWFDIDWLTGPIVLPVLDDDRAALDDLTVVDGELRYHEHAFPLAPDTGEGPPREVHQRQHYRLVNALQADTALNYRRCFAVTELASVRVEEPEVFDATHREVLRWHAAGELAGIRVDHPDGMRIPGAYFDRLRAAAPGAWILAEKILEADERLPDWPVDGATGCDALRQVCGLFVDPLGEASFDALELELTGQVVDWGELARRCKREVATGMLAAELRRLVSLARPDAASGSRVRDALAEVLAGFAVCRSYLPVGMEHLNHALAEAARRRPDLRATVRSLAPRLADPADELAQRFQQTCSAVAAKGVERAFYRWSRFVALNEVGGDPNRFGTGLAEFHTACQERQQRQPWGMTTLAAHDSKRSEDVRARMAVLAELPSEWAEAARGWSATVPMPDPGFGHVLWQTVIGAWPISRERLRVYAIKAGRQARVWTSWEDPDCAAEAAVLAAVDRIYRLDDLRESIDRFARTIAPYGWSNSLGQKLVQLTMPGVPDTCQGTELWDNSLVDPDNRPPADYLARRELLARLDSGWLPPVDAVGAAKLLVVSRALRLRRDAPERFDRYQPMLAEGAAADHAVAYDRGGVAVVATRLPVRLARGGGWQETVLPLPDGEWVDALTLARRRGGRPRLVEVLADYPVALLVRS